MDGVDEELRHELEIATAREAMTQRTLTRS